MSKVRKFAESTPNLPFSEFNFYELYRETFEHSELGRMKKILPLHEMAESFGLVRKSMTPKHGLVDDKTLVYANLYYNCASPVWNGILKELLKLQCKFVEPVSENGNAGAIRIFHPGCRLFKEANQVQGNERAVNEVNNSSVVYGIKLNEHIMVFPGDLEQKGFENMSRAGKCRSLLFRADYYVVSHHGSINGHPALACASPSQPIPTVLECATNGLNKAILMGRNGAYSGIYSPVVENYWNTVCGLEYTEKAKHYVELEWNSGAVTTK